MSQLLPNPWQQLSGERSRKRVRKLDELPDDELMVWYVVHDDRAAFEELYRRVFPPLLRYAERRVKPRAAAEDLVQQAFLNAHLARDRFMLGSAARPWLTRILVNLVRDHLRARRVRPIADVDVRELAAVEEVSLHESREAVDLARKAIAELSLTQREVITLHWLEERPYPEVAVALGERVSTLKVRAHRAYKELRRTLAANDDSLVRNERKC
jgi:RNA polymerase sigma-70 factor (ECF subfamily)